MSWVKRNLYFVIGTAVAVVLLGLAGWYLYSKWDLNNKNLEQLNEAYGKLQTLSQQNPHPGSGNVNNVETAKEQQKQLRAFIQKTRSYFQKIPAIPDVPRIRDQDFSEALTRSISQLRHDATNASVGLPPDYGFSFETERRKMTFDPNGLPLMAIQLGEVKAICDVLMQAKINALDSLRRERVSTDDMAGSQTDYLGVTSVTNELAVLSPYEVSFRSFSPELASVLAGFATSPYGFIIKTITVEPAAPLSDVTSAAAQTPITPVATYVPPQPIPPRYQPEGESSRRIMTAPGLPPPPGATFRPDRYAPNPYPTPAPMQPVMQQPGGTGPGAAASRGGLQTVIDERQLKITMLVEAVKLLPPAK
jgi:hypothetical protein